MVNTNHLTLCYRRIAGELLSGARTLATQSVRVPVGWGAGPLCPSVRGPTPQGHLALMLGAC